MKPLPKFLISIWIPIMCSAIPCEASPTLSVLPERINQVETRKMVRQYLLDQAEKAFLRREAAFEEIETPGQMREHQRRMREFLRAQLGDFPARTPLQARVVGRHQRDGYSVERILYQSRPGHFVTALLYLPEAPPPYPGVLIACGHAPSAKSTEMYQRAGVLLAKGGMAALCYDPIGQGERHQILHADGRPRFENGIEHMLVAVSSIPLGLSAATYRIWDGIRGIDYLTSREEIDPDRIGLTGNSGGGLVTTLLMALDERVACAAPSCYITHVKEMLHTQGPGDSEQQVYGEIAQGLGHADYLMIRAPKPTLICAATRDDMFDISGSWRSLREAKRFYGSMGYPERVDLVEADVAHGFFRPLREGMARWMRRWLVGIDDDALREDDSPLLSEEAGSMQEFITASGPDYSEFRPVRLPVVRCSPEGQVQLIPGARSVFQLNREREKELAVLRRAYWRQTPRDEALEEVRRLAGIRRLHELPPLTTEAAGTLRRPGYTIHKLVLHPEPGIRLPALRFVPDGGGRGLVLYLHGEGKHVDAGPDGPIEKQVRDGREVLAVDLRGVGETEPAKGKWGYGPLFGADWEEFYMAYMLGRSYLGMRAEEILSIARHLAAVPGSDAARRVHLVGIGEAGPPALHAAALEPALFASLDLRWSLVSWSNLIQTEVPVNQLVNTVHGALRKYDLPDLLKTLSGMKVTVVEPTGGAGETLP
jgi:dienelactone hydrolase